MDNVGEFGGGLFVVPDPIPQAATQPPPAPDPSQALAATAEMIAGGPAALLADSVDPSQGSKFPFALAALGACIVGVLLADHLDKKR
jgi:hypothetical protein